MCELVARVANANMHVVSGELFTHSIRPRARANFTKRSEPKEWCFALSLFKLTNIHDMSRNTTISVCSFKYMIETSTVGHSKCTSKRLVFGSPGSHL
jgi:hypothetical protein